MIIDLIFHQFFFLASHADVKKKKKLKSLLFATFSRNQCLRRVLLAGLALKFDSES